MKTVFGLVGTVLAALLMVACQRDEFAIKILADKSLIGTEVMIDGTKVGSLEGNESSGAHFSKWVSREPHRVQLRNGSTIVHDETITVRASDSEYYVQVKPGSSGTR